VKTATIRAAEDPSASIVVIVSPVPVDALFTCVERVGKLPRTRKAFAELAATFAPFLESWSYDPPATAEGLMQVDYNLALAIIRRWATEVAEAPLPLLVSSSDGDPSEAPAAPSQ
jgi:hypothetical protein